MTAPQGSGPAPAGAPDTAARAKTYDVELAARLWPLLKRRWTRRKTVPYAEAVEHLGIPPDGVLDAAWPLHVWCWVRGMPPLNVLLVPRGTTAAPEGGFTATDFDVFHEALGRSIYTLEDAWFYPWDKVPDPEPADLARALDLHARHAATIRAFRFLDLEVDLRHRDEARGRRRPVPAPYESWGAVERAHADAIASLGAAGMRLAELRPPGKAPYPPPRPVTGNWAD